MRFFGALNRQPAPQLGGHARAVYEAGWRPGLGWLCLAAIALHFCAIPALNVWCSLHGQALALSPFDLPSINTLLTTTLTMGGLRTLEKFWGVATPTDGVGSQTIVINPAPAAPVAG